MSEQWLIPGCGYVDEEQDGEQWLIPGCGYVDEGATEENIFSFVLSIDQQKNFVLSIDQQKNFDLEL